MTEKRAEWWSGVKKVVNKPGRIIIGSKEENPTMLSSCDWLDVFVDQQIQVKRGERKNSFWLLDVAEKGTYEFELRRWPKEYDMPLSGAGPGEMPLPVSQARLFIREDETEILRMTDVDKADKKVAFTVDLEPGPIELHTWFLNSSGESLTGAYYVYVSRK